jgi:thiamine-monophosphate kinase
MRLDELGEDAFLQELAQAASDPKPHVALGIGDDAAVVCLPEGELALFATDALVENVHFRLPQTAPRFLGRKAVAVNASDLAAMGGHPLAVLLSLTTRANEDVTTLRAIVDGVAERADSFDASLVGGNLAVTDGPLVVDVSILGSTEGKRYLKRSGGLANQAVFVSGRIGASACGRALLDAGVVLGSGGGVVAPESLGESPLQHAESAILAHIDPEPRLSLGRALAERGLATACVDVSDGLSIDLHRLCRASGVGARIYESALPLAPALLSWERAFGREPLERALGGGEDYELLFSTSDAKAVEALRDETECPLTRIGELTEQQGLVLVQRDGGERRLEPTGWDHFRPGSEGGGGRRL